MACTICIGAMGFRQLAVQAEEDCWHEKTTTDREQDGYFSDDGGHMERTRVVEVCCKCKNPVHIAFDYGAYEGHDPGWAMIEDLQNGLYMFEVNCNVCGYHETTMSDDPNDPKV